MPVSACQLQNTSYEDRQENALLGTGGSGVAGAGLMLVPSAGGGGVAAAAGGFVGAPAPAPGIPHSTPVDLVQVQCGADAPCATNFSCKNLQCEQNIVQPGPLLVGAGLVALIFGIRLFAKRAGVKEFYGN